MAKKYGVTLTRAEREALIAKGKALALWHRHGSMRLYAPTLDGAGEAHWMAPACGAAAARKTLMRWASCPGVKRTSIAQTLSLGHAANNVTPALIAAFRIASSSVASGNPSRKARST